VQFFLFKIRFTKADMQQNPEELKNSCENKRKT